MKKGTKTCSRAVLVFIAASLGHILIGTYVYSVGYFYVELLEKYGEGALKTSLVGTLNSSLICFLAPFVTVLMNRYTARVVIFAGGILIATGCFLSAFVKSILGLIITFGIIAGTGSALTVVPSLVISGYYFENHRHFVLSAVPVFTGIGMFISTPVATLYIKMLGLHGAYLVMSGQMLQICVIAIICKPSKVEVELIEKTKNKKMLLDKNGIPTDKNKNIAKSNIKEKSYRPKGDLVLQISFILFLISTATSNMIFGTFQFHLPNYLIMTNESKEHTEVVMTILGVGNTLGRAFSALVLLKGSEYGLHVHITSLFISGIAAIVYPFYDNFVPLNYIFAFVIGCTTGAPYGVMASIVLTILGMNWLSTAFGIAYLFCGIGVFCGPIFASYLLDINGNYDSSFICIGGGGLAGGFCAILTALIVRYRNQSRTLQCKQ